MPLKRKPTMTSANSAPVTAKQDIQLTEDFSAQIKNSYLADKPEDLSEEAYYEQLFDNELASTIPNDEELEADDKNSVPVSKSSESAIQTMPEMKSASSLNFKSRLLAKKQEADSLLREVKEYLNSEMDAVFESEDSYQIYSEGKFTVNLNVNTMKPLVKGYFKENGIPFEETADGFIVKIDF